MSKKSQVYSSLKVTPLPPEQVGDVSRYSASIIFPDGRRDVLWFELCSNVEVSHLADPFVVALLFEAMAADASLQVSGQVSAGLLWRLNEFMEIWSQLIPSRYSRIQILADEIVTDTLQATGQISTFSGGVDSCFTAFKHAVGDPLLPKIDVGLMVHGFDIPFDDPSFEGALASSRRMLESIGMQTIWMRTNIRVVNRQWWPDVFGSAIAACLHLLTPSYGRAYIPSSFAYSAGALINGSNPLTDPLLSSDVLQIIHDGAIYTRNEKLRAIAHWSEGVNGLRVCWQGELRDRNCCRCEKCIRNMLNFQLEGLLIPAAFGLPLTSEAIKALRLGPTEAPSVRIDVVSIFQPKTQRGGGQ